MSDETDMAAEIEAAAEESIALLTGRPCVLYRIYAANGRLLYVGISTGPAARIKQHEGDKPWWCEVSRIDVSHFETPEEAVQAERQAIATENPLHNISGGVGRAASETRARRRAELAEQEAREEAELEETLRTHYIADAPCTNCQWVRHKIPRGTRISEHHCGKCGCQALGEGKIARL